MGHGPIESALARLETALMRIDEAQQRSAALHANDRTAQETSTDRVSALVNRHEMLREEVAETVRKLDLLIEEHGP